MALALNNLQRVGMPLNKETKKKPLLFISTVDGWWISTVDGWWISTQSLVSLSLICQSPDCFLEYMDFWFPVKNPYIPCMGRPEVLFGMISLSTDLWPYELWRLLFIMDIKKRTLSSPSINPSLSILSSIGQTPKLFFSFSKSFDFY